MFSAVLMVIAPGNALPGSAPGQFSSRVNVVEVYATVTNDRGVVTGLTADDFVIEEDGIRQSVSVFAAGDLPLSVAIGLDRSFSMSRDRLDRAKNAARRFIGALRPADRLMVLAIGSDTEIAAPLSTDRAAALAAVDRLEPWGTTPLFDAALTAVDAVQSGTGRRALLLLSDGDDRYSKATTADVIQRARQSDVLIYPIALGKERPAAFTEFAAVTGGRSFQVNDDTQLRTTVDLIALELRSQYLLGYTPRRPPEGRAEWRSISVTVNRPNARVRARKGYMTG